MSTPNPNATQSKVHFDPELHTLVIAPVDGAMGKDNVALNTPIRCRVVAFHSTESDDALQQLKEENDRLKQKLEQYQRTNEILVRKVENFDKIQADQLRYFANTEKHFKEKLNRAIMEMQGYKTHNTSLVQHFEKLKNKYAPLKEKKQEANDTYSTFDYTIKLLQRIDSFNQKSNTDELTPIENELQQRHQNLSLHDAVAKLVKLEGETKSLVNNCALTLARFLVQNEKFKAALVDSSIEENFDQQHFANYFDMKKVKFLQKHFDKIFDKIIEKQQIERLLLLHLPKERR